MFGASSELASAMEFGFYWAAIQGPQWYTVALNMKLAINSVHDNNFAWQLWNSQHFQVFQTTRHATGCLVLLNCCEWPIYHGDLLKPLHRLLYLIRSQSRVITGSMFQPHTQALPSTQEGAKNRVTGHGGSKNTKIPWYSLNFATCWTFIILSRRHSAATFLLSHHLRHLTCVATPPCEISGNFFGWQYLAGTFIWLTVAQCFCRNLYICRDSVSDLISE